MHHRLSSSVRLAAVSALVLSQAVPVPGGGAAGVSLGLAPAAAQTSVTSQIECRAQGNRPVTCPLPAGTTSVTFLGPDRSARCQEGRTWVRTGDRLRVWGGCGGTFEAVVAQGGGGWGGGWGGQGYASEISCRSTGNREQRCRVRTEGRALLVEQLSQAPCIEGQTWRSDPNAIVVRGGCHGRFAVGYGNLQPSPGNPGWGGGQWGQRGYAAMVECRSRDNRFQRCAADTQGRVDLVRQFSDARCVEGRSFGHDRQGVWVSNGCQARFGVGFGPVMADTSPDRHGGGGANAGLIIGGAALAAGLIAILSRQGGSANRAAAAGPAALEADLGRLPAVARPAAEACLAEAARQVGQTGGTRVRLDAVDSAQPSGAGWMILSRLTAIWPDHSQSMAMDCRTTGDRVTAFDVR